MSLRSGRLIVESAEAGTTPHPGPLPGRGGEGGAGPHPTPPRCSPGSGFHLASLRLRLQSRDKSPSISDLQAAFGSGCKLGTCRGAFLLVFFGFSERFSRENSVARRRSLLSLLSMTRV